MRDRGWMTLSEAFLFSGSHSKILKSINMTFKKLTLSLKRKLGQEELFQAMLILPEGFLCVC